MGSDLNSLFIPNNTYPSFPNVSKKYISEDTSFLNHSDSGRSMSSDEFINYFIEVISITILVISIFGAVGNGIVIWLLGFRIKGTPFSIFILNLAVADLGFLLLAMGFIFNNCFEYWFGVKSLEDISMVFFYLIVLMYSAGHFFLTAISIDRCVAVFFPLWHQRKRSPRLSTIVCAVVWVLSILLTAITCTLHLLDIDGVGTEHVYQWIVNAGLCLPVISIATVALFIKVCLKASLHRRGRLLTVILLTLLFFLLFAFPLNVIYIATQLGYIPGYIDFGGLLLASLNSSINPVIYFLVGRQWKSRRMENLKMILQNIFKEEESCGEETAVETSI